MDIEKMWVEHRPAMVAACRRVLRNEADVEDAVSEAILEVLKHPEREAPKNWKAWLCHVAVNKAKDRLRRKKREADLQKKLLPGVNGIVPNWVRRVDLRMSPQELRDRIGEFLTADRRENFALFCEVELKIVTRKQLAAELGLSGEALNARLRRARNAAREAAIAVCLVDDRGPGRCDDLWRRFGGREGSPALLGAIKAHAVKCHVCREKWCEPTWLLRSVLVVVGSMTGLLAWIGRGTTGKNVAVTGAAAAVTAVVLALFAGGMDTTRREPVDLLPVPVPHTVDSTAPTSTYPPAGSLPSPSPTSRTSEPPSRPAEQPPPFTSSTPTTTSAPTTTGTPTSTSGGGRDASPPAVANGWIERRKIFTAPRGTCGDKPTTSTVTATITAPAGVSTATVHLRRRGLDFFSFPMTNAAGTSSWHTEIRGLEGRKADGGYSVLVEAVGADGLRQVTKIGTICVSGCHAFPPGRGSGT